MHYNTLKNTSVFRAGDDDSGGALVDRIDDAADRIVLLFSQAKLLPKELTPEFLREQIAEAQLAGAKAHEGLLLAAAVSGAPFTDMEEDADIFGILNDVVGKLDQLKDFKDLGVYNSAEVSREFESTNYDNFLNTFKGIATEVADISAAAATGVPSVDVSSIVNSITDSLATAMNHEKDTLEKTQDARLVASRKGPNGPEYLGINYHYEYKLEQATSCGTTKRKGHYRVKKVFFVSYSLAQFRELYAKAFPEEKEYTISLYYGDQVLEGSGPVLLPEQVEGRIIKALGGTVSGLRTTKDVDQASVFSQLTGRISIAEPGIVALLKNTLKTMTLKKVDPDDSRTSYFTIEVSVSVKEG